MHWFHPNLIKELYLYLLYIAFTFCFLSSQRAWLVCVIFLRDSCFIYQEYLDAGLWKCLGVQAINWIILFLLWVVRKAKQGWEMGRWQGLDERGCLKLLVSEELRIGYGCCWAGPFGSHIRSLGATCFNWFASHYSLLVQASRCPC